MSTENIKEVVKTKYGQFALRVQGGSASCCGPAPAVGGGCDPITSNLYSAQQSGDVPDEALQASLGCGNPTALAQLKPGGRFAVSDVVVTGEVPAAIRKNVELWIGCVAGALSDSDYTAKLAAAGFEHIGIEPTRIYSVEDARQFLAGQGFDVDAIAAQVDGKFMSAFVRASKPSGGETQDQ